MDLQYSKYRFIARLATRLDDFKWWFLHRLHPNHRYHVHKFHKLAPGWHDVDYKMLHACFDLLVEFVEKEKGLEILKLQYTHIEENGEFCPSKVPDEFYSIENYNRAKEIYNEVKELYDWWKPLTAEQIDDMEFFTSKDVNLCTDQLIRLIKVRKYLWT